MSGRQGKGNFAGSAGMECSSMRHRVIQWMASCIAELQAQVRALDSDNAELRRRLNALMGLRANRTTASLLASADRRIATAAAPADGINHNGSPSKAAAKGAP